MGCIGVIADAHANLPATRAALDALRAAGCEEMIVHVGDAVGIGPHPAEVVSLLIEEDVRYLMGNHDEWSAFGLPSLVPAWMSPGEAKHQQWTSGQLSEALRERMTSWPYELAVRLGTCVVGLLHYARRPNGAFDHILKVPAADELRRLYDGVPGDVVVFGHDHRACDLIAGGRRFLNPGSLGCHDKAAARALLLTPMDDTVSIRKDCSAIRRHERLA